MSVCGIVKTSLMTLLNMMLTYMTYDIEYCGIQSRAGRIRLNIIHLSNKKRNMNIMKHLINGLKAAETFRENVQSLTQVSRFFSPIVSKTLGPEFFA